MDQETMRAEITYKDLMAQANGIIRNSILKKDLMSAIKDGVNDRLSNLLCATFLIHSVQNMLMSEALEIMEDYNFSRMGVGRVTKALQKAEDDFYTTMAPLMGHDTDSKVKFSKEFDELYDLFTTWYRIPKTWKPGEPNLLQVPTGKNHLRIENPNGTIAEMAPAMIPRQPEEGVKEKKEWMVAKLLNDAGNSYTTVRTKIKNKGEATKIARDIAMELKGEMFVIFECTEKVCDACLPKRALCMPPDAKFKKDIVTWDIEGPTPEQVQEEKMKMSDEEIKRTVNGYEKAKRKADYINSTIDYEDM